MRSPAEARLACQVELVRAKRLAAGVMLDENWWQRLKDRWPHRLACEMSCGPGWSDLIEGVNELIDQEGEGQIAFTQIKEKFGALRMYWHGADPMGRLDVLIDSVEEISEGMCETCGRPSKMRQSGGSPGGYIHSACDDHAIKGSSIIRVKTESFRTSIGRIRATKIEDGDNS